MKAATPNRKYSLMLARWKWLCADHPDRALGDVLWSVACDMYPVVRTFAGGMYDSRLSDRNVPGLLHLLLWQNEEDD